MLIFESPYPQLDKSSITFCVTRNRLLFKVHEIISQLLRDFFLFSSKKQTFFGKRRLFEEKEDLICLLFQKGLLSRPRSTKVDPVGITAVTFEPRHENKS